MATPNRKKNSIILLGLSLIFIVPMIAAWLSYSRGLFLSDNKVHHGVLLQPSYPLANLALTNTNGHPINNSLRGKWWMLYFTEEPKTPLAARHLYFIRQIRQATGKNRDRIERAVVTSPSASQHALWVQQHFPGTYYFIISDEKRRQLEMNFSKKLALKKGSLYLVDPLGNIILFYAPDTQPKGILKDLERLLKVSQIG